MGMVMTSITDMIQIWTVRVDQGYWHADPEDGALDVTASPASRAVLAGAASPEPAQPTCPSREGKESLSGRRPDANAWPGTAGT